MTDRDRLAADLLDLGVKWSYVPDDVDTTWDIWTADRLIALGWTRLDEARLARALQRVIDNGEALAVWREDAAAIARAYRDDHE